MYELPVNCCKQIAVTLYGGHLNIKRTTLLAKQNRRLLNEDLRPCTQILKAKYLPKTNIANSNTDLRGICEKKGSVWLLEMGKNPASGLNTHTWLGSCCPLIKGLLSKDHSNKMRERERGCSFLLYYTDPWTQIFQTQFSYPESQPLWHI